VIVGGLTFLAPCTVNTAGTRAFVAGGFAFVVDDVLAPEDVVVDVVEAPAARLVRAPAVVVDVTNVGDVVDADAGAVVEACVELPHDARSGANVNTMKRRAARFNVPSIVADYLSRS
jgi:hypothetical protein